MSGAPADSIIGLFFAKDVYAPKASKNKTLMRSRACCINGTHMLACNSQGGTYLGAVVNGSPNSIYLEMETTSNAGNELVI